jgi:hypothetical protein
MEGRLSRDDPIGDLEDPFRSAGRWTASPFVRGQCAWLCLDRVEAPTNRQPQEWGGFPGAVSAPTGLRPELVPSVEILDVFRALGNAAVIELKDQADVHGESLAVSLTRVLLHPGH